MSQSGQSLLSQLKSAILLNQLIDLAYEVIKFGKLNHIKLIAFI